MPSDPGRRRAPGPPPPTFTPPRTQHAIGRAPVDPVEVYTSRRHRPRWQPGHRWLWEAYRGLALLDHGRTWTRLGLAVALWRRRLHRATRVGGG